MTIFLVGSGPGDDTGGIREVWDAFVASARDRGRQNGSTRLTLCILGTPESAADFLPAYTEPILKRWPEVSLEVVHLTDPDDNGAETIQWPESLDDVTGLLVCGGWTPGYLSALTARRDVIARLVRQDVPYLGFSAGASIASRHALIGGWKHRGRQVQQEISGEGLEDLTVTDGLSLVTPLVQVHTDAWSNEGVVVTALEHGMSGHAVSIDELTCLAIDPVSGRTARLGEGRIRWYSREHDGVLVRTDEPEAAEDAAPLADPAAPADTAASTDVTTDATEVSDAPDVEAQPPADQS